MVALEKHCSDWESRQEKLDSLSKFAIAKSKNPKLKRSTFFPKNKNLWMNWMHWSIVIRMDHQRRTRRRTSVLSPWFHHRRHQKEGQRGQNIRTGHYRMQRKHSAWTAIARETWWCVHCLRDNYSLGTILRQGYEENRQRTAWRGRVDFSPTTFFRHFDKYVANSSALPVENYFGSKRGWKQGLNKVSLLKRFLKPWMVQRNMQMFPMYR